MADEPSEPVAGSGGRKWYQEQLGPLPAGVWLLVVAVAVVYTVIKKKSATTTNAPSASAVDNSTQPGFDPNAIDPSTGLSYAQEVASGVAPGAGTIDPNTGVPYAQEYSTYPGGAPPVNAGYGNLQPITDNVSWERQAITVLTAKGYDPVLATQAMSDYLNGVALSPAEQAMESLAIQLIGPPPSPPLVPPSNGPGTGNNPPPPAPPPAPPQPATPPPAPAPVAGDPQMKASYPVFGNVSGKPYPYGWWVGKFDGPPDYEVSHPLEYKNPQGQIIVTGEKFTSS